MAFCLRFPASKGGTHSSFTLPAKLDALSLRTQAAVSEEEE